ncbi:MAG: GGDEF domain-containing protein [Anaerolineales bacterium]|nr:GGDEF domain-containing protein [Anaerolineales bacterium]
MSRRLNHFFLRLGKGGVFSFSILLVVLLGWLDYITGFEVSFSYFYLLPISLVTWYVGIRSGLFITGLGVLSWLGSNWLAGEVYTSEWIRYFNAGVRLAVFSMIASLFYQLKTAIESERALARTDYLTGVFNRREFTEQLELEIKRANRFAYPVSLAYIDLDNFKQVNDVYGHSVGDEHLKLIAASVSVIIRKTDLFARLGGDEFGLFLPNVDQRGAKITLEKIERAVLHELRRLNSPVTLSAGVITFNCPPKSVDLMLKEADALMYNAKQAGKKKILYIEIIEGNL